jgi:hypothetical protein
MVLGSITDKISNWAQATRPNSLSSPKVAQGPNWAQTGVYAARVGSGLNFYTGRVDGILRVSYWLRATCTLQPSGVHGPRSFGCSRLFSPLRVFDQKSQFFQYQSIHCITLKPYSSISIIKHISLLKWSYFPFYPRFDFL